MEVISNLILTSKSCLCPIWILKKTIQILSFITLCVINVKNLAVLQYMTWICKFKLVRIARILELHLLFQAAQSSPSSFSKWWLCLWVPEKLWVVIMMLMRKKKKKVYDKRAKSSTFILIPLLWRERITKLFRRNTSSPSITIERKNLFMNRSASIWIAVNYAHASCVKGKNVSVIPRKAGIISSWFVLLQRPAEAMVAFSSELFSKC